MTVPPSVGRLAALVLSLFTEVVAFAAPFTLVVAFAAPFTLVVALAAPATALSPREAAYTVSGVPVDVTAASGADARLRAFSEAEAKATQQLLRRLIGPADQSRLPARINESTVQGLVRDVEVEEEKASAVRYIARLAVHFKPAAVRSYIRSLGISFAEPATRPTVVVTLFQEAATAPYQLWTDTNPWRAAWASITAAGGLVPVSLPLGDLADQGGLSAQQAAAADPVALDAMARRLGAERAVVVTAVVRDPGGDNRPPVVEVRMMQPGELSPPPAERVAGAPGEPLQAVLEKAARGLKDRLDDDWRRRTAVPSVLAQGGARQMTAMVPVASLEDWVAIRRALAKVRVITRTDVQAMNRGLVQLNLQYVGDEPQLMAALAQAGLGFEGEGSVRRLGRLAAVR